MNDFNSWTKINWYALAGLFTQLAFLIAGVWFARNFLRTLRAFQEQIGALLKLSITSGTDAHAQTRRYVADASRYWLAPTETQMGGSSGSHEARPDRLVTAWHRLVLWLQEPMHTAEASTWRRLMTWLQAPTGT
jgi:hypothetical protein